MLDSCNRSALRVSRLFAAFMATSIGARHEGLFPLRQGPLVSNFVKDLTAHQRSVLRKDVARAIDGLNWMHGEFHRPPPLPATSAADFEKVAFLHYQAQLRIEGLAFQAQKCESALTPQEALTHLLKGRTPYSELASSTVVAWQLSSVALPSSVHGSPFLDELLPKQVSNYLAAYEHEMIRPTAQVEATSEILGEPNSYMDERLKRSPNLYARLIKKMQENRIS